jgi:DNA processing protein
VRPDGRGWPPEFGRDEPELEALLILAHLETLTPRRFLQLAWGEGSARACLQAIRRGAAGERDGRIAESVDVSEVRGALSACGARPLGPGNKEYPACVLDLADPPALLFARGRSLEEVDAAVAVVGARSCSAYGREVAETIGRGLASNGVSVVSGAALGVDAAAHRGALSVQGSTIAVLGSGIDVAYPSANRGLLTDIVQVGTVVSEYPPGVSARPRRFPARNRLIAALSRAVVVVEGGAGSGSLITAEFAVDLNREVFAVPGPVTSPLSAVPHELLRDGATLIRGAEDVLDDLRIGRLPDGSDQLAAPDGLSAEERRVLEGVVGEPVTAEAVASRAALPISTALSVLMSLEVRGLVRGIAGRYQRTGVAAGVAPDIPHPR